MGSLHRVERVEKDKVVRKAVDRGEPLRAAGLGARDDIRRFVAPDPAVDLDTITHAPAKELVDGHAEALPFDVPERDVQPGERRLSPSGVES